MGHRVAQSGVDHAQGLNLEGQWQARGHIPRNDLTGLPGGGPILWCQDHRQHANNAEATSKAVTSVTPSRRFGFLPVSAAARQPQVSTCQGMGEAHGCPPAASATEQQHPSPQSTIPRPPTSQPSREGRINTKVDTRSDQDPGGDDHDRGFLGVPMARWILEIDSSMIFQT